MCGFIALWGEVDDALLTQMMSRIEHRGPDGKGMLHLGRCKLGHLRLAIVDVDGGAQPMTNENGDMAIAFNGEIYNHLSLRHAIESRHHFKTYSDTEVLLHLFEECGESMLTQLDGMFAFALATPRDLLLARDPIGIKPLYYGYKNGAFIAASEIKAFPVMDELHMLPAGHAIRPGKKPWRFADPYPSTGDFLEMPMETILSEIRSRLEKAVVKRLMSDVPLGVFLSGGLDSSLIAAMMRPHTSELLSFTAGMKDAPDLSMARMMADALSTRHYEIQYTTEEMEKALPGIIYALESFDAPLVRSAIPMHFLSQLASEHVKVALTGEGADELFAGYAYLEQYTRNEDLALELAGIVERLQDTNLQRADRITMLHGIEGRVPFLDRDLVGFMATLSAEYKKPLPHRSEKWLLRQACQDLLPHMICYRKKQKFSEGAGSASVFADHIQHRISASEFARDRVVAPGIILRSPEELYYYRIWRDVMGHHTSPQLAGRTRDLSAAA